MSLTNSFSEQAKELKLKKNITYYLLHIEHIGTVSLAKSLIRSNSRVMVFFTKLNLKSHASEFIVVGKHTLLGWVKFAF